MRKVAVVVVLFLLLTSAAQAEVRLRMESPDSIVLTADNPCEKLAALELFGDDDDNTSSNSAANKALLEALQDTSLADDEDPLPYKSQPDLPFISKYAFARVTDQSIFAHELNDTFDAIRGRIIRDVQRVNWPTGYQISQADMSFKQKLQFVLGKACGLALPAMSTYGISADPTQVNKVSQKIADNIQYAMLDAKLKKEVRYTPEGLYFAILTTKPFLLLTIDDEVFNNLLKVEAKILLQYNRTDKDRLLVQLLLNIEKFLDIRAKFHQDEEFMENTKKLAKFTKLSVGDAWSTYKVLADHSIRMELVAQENQLTPKYEENTFLSLKKVFMNIGKDVAKHKTEVVNLRKDPNYKEMVSRVDNEYQHTSNVKADAAKELKDMKEQDKELLLRVYGK